MLTSELGAPRLYYNTSVQFCLYYISLLTLLVVDGARRSGGSGLGR